MLTFGMPTLIELDDIESCAALCRELGLAFVEINMNMPLYQPDRLDVGTLQRLRDAGVFFTFHLDENFSPGDFNRRVADAWVDTALRTIDIALETGAPVINMHMAEGVHFKLPDRKVYLFERYHAEYMEALARFREACTAAIGGGGLLVCIENCGGYPPYSKKGIDYLLESPCFALTLDIGHSDAAGRADEPFIMARAGRLQHMHVHDSLRGRCHLPLGEGEIDIPQYLRLAEKCGCRCVLETKNIAGLRRSVDYIRNIGL